MDSYEVDRIVENAISRLRGDLQYEIEQVKRDLYYEIQELERRVQNMQRGYSE